MENGNPDRNAKNGNYRWNEALKVWEFYEASWGGWCVLRITPSSLSKPMSFSEGINYIILNPLVRGREPETGWIRDRLSYLNIDIHPKP